MVLQADPRQIYVVNCRWNSKQSHRLRPCSTAIPKRHFRRGSCGRVCLRAVSKNHTFKVRNSPVQQIIPSTKILRRCFLTLIALLFLWVETHHLDSVKYQRHRTSSVLAVTLTSRLTDPYTPPTFNSIMMTFRDCISRCRSAYLYDSGKNTPFSVRVSVFFSLSQKRIALKRRSIHESDWSEVG